MYKISCFWPFYWMEYVIVAPTGWTEESTEPGCSEQVQVTSHHHLIIFIIIIVIVIIKFRWLNFNRMRKMEKIATLDQQTAQLRFKQKIKSCIVTLKPHYKVFCEIFCPCWPPWKITRQINTLIWFQTGEWWPCISGWKTERAGIIKILFYIGY